MIRLTHLKKNCGQCRAWIDHSNLCLDGREDPNLADARDLLFHRIKQRAAFFLLAGWLQKSLSKAYRRHPRPLCQAMALHLDDLEAQLELRWSLDMRGSPLLTQG